MALFTAETAAEMGRRSAEARKRAAQAAVESAIIPLPTEDFKSQALVRVRKQLENVDLALDGCDDPKDWDCLTRAKERLFRAWVHLAGIPGPGNLKPSAPRQRASMPTVEPLNCGPNTPTGSVPPAV